MANLMDAIQKNTSALATQKQGMTDETGKLQTLLRAKSGREVGGGDTSASNLGEASAVANTNATMQNTVAPAATIQNAGMQAQAEGQQQAVNAQKQDIAQSRSYDNMNTRIKTTQILQDLSQGMGKIDQQRKDAMVSQAAQNLRLQNAQYVDTLQREGAKERLDDSNQFNESLEQAIIGSNTDILKDSLGNKSVLDANDQEFSRAMGQMTTDNAYEIFQNEMKSSKERGLYSAIGTAAGLGAGAAAGAGGESSYSDSVATANEENASPTSDRALMESRH